jgi:hypothetical protein
MSLIEILKQVLASWQVIVVTLVIFMYFYIVSYAARKYHRPRASKKLKGAKKKKATPPAGVNLSGDTNSESESGETYTEEE